MSPCIGVVTSSPYCKKLLAKRELSDTASVPMYPLSRKAALAKAAHHSKRTGSIPIKAFNSLLFARSSYPIYR